MRAEPLSTVGKGYAGGLDAVPLIHAWRLVYSVLNNGILWVHSGRIKIGGCLGNQLVFQRQTRVSSGNIQPSGNISDLQKNSEVKWKLNVIKVLPISLPHTSAPFCPASQGVSSLCCILSMSLVSQGKIGVVQRPG